MEKEETKRNKKKRRTKLNVTVETINENPNKLAPFVGYFPSGFDPTRQPNPPEVQVCRHRSRPKRVQLVVKPNGSGVDFVGTNFSGEATAGKMCTYALGLLDKETQKLRVVPIASNRIFRLDPKVRGKSIEKEPSTPAAGELSGKKRLEKIRDLTNAYGTKKAIKMAKKMSQLRQNDGASLVPEFDQMLEEGSAIDKEALASTSADASRNVPPYDLSATTPEVAYPLEKIILKGEWDYLLDILELLKSGKELMPEVYPTFVCNRVYKLDLIQDESMKKRLASILSYITHLIKFKDRHSLNGFTSSKHHKLPSILFQKFLKMFVDEDKKRLADEKIALLISYVLVLTLIFDEFNSDFKDIAADLKMTPGSLRPHFENLGCKFMRKNNTSFATLPVPLQFPVQRKRLRRR